MVKATNVDTPQNFQVQLDRSLLQKYNYTLVFDRVVDTVFYAQEVQVPGVKLGAVPVPSFTNDVPIPGDKLEFEQEFLIQFVLDENIRAYRSVYQWLVQIRSPISTDTHQLLRYPQLQRPLFDPNKPPRGCYSDARLVIRGGNGQEVAHYHFVDCFPTGLPGFMLKSTEDGNEPTPVQASFAYSYFVMTLPEDEPLPPGAPAFPD